MFLGWVIIHLLNNLLVVHGHIRPFLTIEVHTISVPIVNTQRIIMYSNQLLDDVSNFSHSRSIPSICAIPTTATTLPFPQCLRSIIAMCTSLFVIMTLKNGVWIMQWKKMIADEMLSNCGMSNVSPWCS